MKRVLALSGGSVKGAWEAGAIKAVLDAGFKPDIVYGISVGNLNGAFMTNAASGLSFNEVDWKRLAEELKNFWYSRIKGPDDIVKSRFLKGIPSILFNRFNGLFRTEPIDRLIDETVTPDGLKNSPIDFYCGCTNIYSGEIEYYNARVHPEYIVNAIKASKAIPFFMEGVTFKSVCTGTADFFVDGGVRDVIPLRPVFNAHKDLCEIVVVSVHPDKLEPVAERFDHGRLLDFANRTMDIIANETAANDIKLALAINELTIEKSKSQRPRADATALTATVQGKEVKNVKIHHINPDKQSDVAIDLRGFTSADIDRLYQDGLKQARRKFKFKPDCRYTEEEYLTA